MSETETGMKNTEIIHPSHDSLEKGNRLFITCGGNTGSSLVAGQITCETIKTYFHSFLDGQEDISVDFIEKAIRMGEIALSEYRKSHPERQELSTALSLFYLASDCVYLCQIGESRIYQIRENRIVYETIDASPGRKIRGAHQPVEINVVILKDVRPDDQFLISNCNPFNAQDEKNICEILKVHATAEEKLSQIKTYYLNKYKRRFSGHLVPLRGVYDAQAIKRKINKLVYSFI